MTKEKIRAELVACLRAIQEASGRDVPRLADDVRPLTDLPGFESLNGEEVALELQERLKCRIDHHARLFGSGKHPRSIAEIVDRLYQISRKEKART